MDAIKHGGLYSKLCCSQEAVDAINKKQEEKRARRKAPWISFHIMGAS